MSVLDRAALEDSPLADLHTIASEMTIDGYRRLRKAALIDAILERAGVTGATAAETAEADADADAVGSEAEVASAAEVAEVAAATDVAEEGEEAESVETADTGETAETDDAGAGAPSGEATRRRRGRRGGRGRGAAREDAVDATPEPELEPEPEPEPEPAVEAEIVVEAEPEVRPEAADVQVEGVVELLANGSGFIRSTPGETSDDDVYISATQVKRCELVTGDRVAGPTHAGIPPMEEADGEGHVKCDEQNDAHACRARRSQNGVRDGAHEQQVSREEGRNGIDHVIAVAVLTQKNDRQQRKTKPPRENDQPGGRRISRWFYRHIILRPPFFQTPLDRRQNNAPDQNREAGSSGEMFQEYAEEKFLQPRLGQHRSHGFQAPLFVPDEVCNNVRPPE